MPFIFMLKCLWLSEVAASEMKTNAPMFSKAVWMYWSGI